MKDRKKDAELQNNITTHTTTDTKLQNDTESPKQQQTEPQSDGRQAQGRNNKKKLLSSQMWAVKS